MQVDPGREFMGAFTKLLITHIVKVRRGRVETRRDYDIVERFNRILAERIFGHQYAQEFLLAARGSSKRINEWVKASPEVIRILNNETTRMIGKKPSEEIKAKSVAQKSSLSIRKQNKAVEVSPSLQMLAIYFNQASLKVDDVVQLILYCH